MMLTPLRNAKQFRRSSLRGRLFECLAESPLPAATVDLWLICAFDLPNGRVRVWQELVDQERRGRVCRLPPWPPSEARRGRWSVRWALTPAGLAAVWQARRNARRRRAGKGGAT
jgi:hypothetical protein